MAETLLVARLILAIVFSVAGLTKLADPRGSRQAMVGFGVPERLAGPAGLLLPLLELAIAVALVPTKTAWAASLAAGGLLLLFILGIGVNLIRGRKPDCHCFGQLYSEPIGLSTIARNIALLAISALIVVEGRHNVGASALTWIADLGTAERVGLVLAVAGFGIISFQFWLLLHLLHQNGRLLGRVEALEAGGAATEPAAAAAEPAAPIHGLSVGAPAPAFTLEGLHGETMTLAALQAHGNPTLLLFTSPGCGPCSALMPDVGNWQREARDRLTVALIVTGTVESNRAKAVEHGLINVLVQQENEVAQAYLSPGTPSAALIGSDGTVARPMAVGADGVRALVTEQLEVLHSPPQSTVAAAPPSTAAPVAAAPLPQDQEAEAVTLGMPAPDFNLPDLNGRQVTPADLRGKETVLLFWNTGCGFCKQMLDDLKAWEHERPEDAPQIVVFSGGPIHDIRAMGLQSIVIPDSGVAYGSHFGANGTPMAVLLDKEGRAASTVAAGAPAVLALSRGGSAAHERGPILLQDSIPLQNGHASGPVAVQRGDPAPNIELPDVDGKVVSLSDFRGHPTLVLFWNTGCGFCQRMLPDLKAWEAERKEDSPKILVVSSSSAEDTRSMGLRSPVVLDAGFSAGPRYGANGTPMALLVDAQGKIASDVAAGADAVLVLANAAPVAVG